MSPNLATIVCLAGIAALFLLAREPKTGTAGTAGTKTRAAGGAISIGLWIPVIWLLLSASRPASEWLAVFGPHTAALPTDGADYYLEGSPVDRNLLICLLVLGIAVLSRRRQQVATLLRRNKLLLAFILYCALSVLWSDYTFVAFKRWIRSLGDLVFVLIVFTELQPTVALRKLLSRAGFVLVPLSVLFIKYYPDLGREYNPWSWVPAYTGVTQNKNELGMLCLIFGLGSVWCLLHLALHRDGTHRFRRMVPYVAIVAMVVWLFWMANSMTSLSCFGMAATVMVAVSFRPVYRRPALLHLLTGGVICVALYALFFSADMVQSLGRDPTLTGRTAIWDAVLSVRGSALVGTGFESFWLGSRLHKVWEMTMPGLQEAHNGYLEVYLNLGWVGVIFLVGLIVTGYRNLIAGFRGDAGKANLRLAFFIAAVIYNFTEAGFRETTLIWIFFLLATFAIPRPAAAQAQPLPEIESSVPWAEFEPEMDPVLAGELDSGLLTAEGI
jgi:exopolysaccharide production protein ExoQ